MALKPWYKVVTPREDLREGKPLDAAEFAVHLDQIRAGKAQPDYVDPQRFLERTFMTRNLGDSRVGSYSPTLRRNDRDVRGIQSGNAVRRRENPCANALVSSRHEWSESRSLDWRPANSREGGCRVCSARAFAQ